MHDIWLGVTCHLKEYPFNLEFSLVKIAPGNDVFVVDKALVEINHK